MHICNYLFVIALSVRKIRIILNIIWKWFILILVQMHWSNLFFFFSLLKVLFYSNRKIQQETFWAAFFFFLLLPFKMFLNQGAWACAVFVMQQQPLHIVHTERGQGGKGKEKRCQGQKRCQHCPERRDQEWGTGLGGKHQFVCEKKKITQFPLYMNVCHKHGITLSYTCMLTHTHTHTDLRVSSIC